MRRSCRPASGWSPKITVPDGHTPPDRLDDLHIRTLRALARAIYSRVGVEPRRPDLVCAYALELGMRLGLPERDVRALEAAAALSCIGCLAAPQAYSPEAEQTPFSHDAAAYPEVAAAVLQSADYLADVTAAVRSHREHWDGAGDPDGLKEETIPLAARILAVAGRLAELTAAGGDLGLPSSALGKLLSGSGTEFDPEIVRVAAADYAALERVSRAVGAAACEAPAAIASARDRERGTWRLLQELGNSLGLSDTLFTLDRGLSGVVPFDAIVVYLLRDGLLVPFYARGENSQLFVSTDMQAVEGAIAWAAKRRALVFNGDPSAEPGYAHNPERTRPLRSMTALPMEDSGELVGILALYCFEPEAFEPSSLGSLLVVRNKAQHAIKNALAYESALRSAAEDALTGLPNTRALFLRLDAELARLRRTPAPLGVLVCELKGLDAAETKFGREAVRRLIHATASGLRGICREEDCVARTGDEFVLVLLGFSAAGFAEKRTLIGHLLSDVSEKELGAPLIETKIAAAFYPEDASDAEGLLACAESRLRQPANDAAGPSHFGARIAELGAVIESFGVTVTTSDPVCEVKEDEN